MTKLDVAKLNTNLDTIESWIDSYDKYLSEWTWDGGPNSTTIGNITISDQGLVGGKFVTDDPNTSYTPPTTGTSEAQLLVIRGALEVYLKTGDNVWLSRVNTLVSGLLNYYYPVPDIPEVPDYKWVPHWLVNVTKPFTSREYYLDGKVHFTNGIATVSFNKVQKVYSVRSTDSTLAYTWAPDAPILSGTNYEIDHVDVTYGDSKATIYLKNTSFTGDTLVAYASDTGPIIQKGEKVEAYPVWRSLEEGEIAAAIDTLPWALDVFKLLYQATNDTKWKKAIDSTVYSIEKAYTVDNTDYYLKPKDATEPVIGNGISSYSERTAATSYSYTDDNTLLVKYGNSVGEESFSSWIGNSLPFTEEKYIEASLGTNVPSVINFMVDEQATYDPDKRWKTVIHTSGLGTAYSELESFVLKPSQFFNSSLIWWGHNYVTTGDGNISKSGNSAVSAYDTTGLVANTTGTYKHIDFTRGDEGGWFGWAQYVIVADFTKLPFDINYRTASNIDFVIVDSNNQHWRYTLPKTSGKFNVAHLTVDLFTNVDNTNATALKDVSYSTIFFDAIDNTSSIDIEYIGIKKIMPTTAGISNVVVSYKDTSALDLAIGYIIPIPNRDPLPYAPYIAPFDMHFVSNKLSDSDTSGGGIHSNGSLSNLRGAPYTGYQAPWIFQESTAFSNNTVTGNVVGLATNLQFLSDSQDYYASNTGLRGFFAPVFWWDYRDDANGHPINSFSMTGQWGNVWGGFQYRTISDVARVLKNDPSNSQAKKIFIDFITGLDTIWKSSDIIGTFPTDFNDSVSPQHNQNDPHMIALLLRALSMGLQANLTQLQQSLVYKLINQGLSYLSSLAIPISNVPFSTYQVEGTFSPNPSINEWYGYWGGDILSSLVHILSATEQFINMSGTTINLGKIIPNFLGDWSSTATYSKMDVVIYSNNSYIALKSVSANVVPTTDTASWALLAKGVPGPKGDTGATGGIPVVAADASSTGAAYTITNITLPSSPSVGYTFKFIPNVISTSNTATLSINGSTPAKFAKFNAYTGARVYAENFSTNVPASFLQNNSPYTLTYFGGYWFILDQPIIDVTNPNGVLPIKNGGTGRTDGGAAALATRDVTFTDFATVATNMVSYAGNWEVLSASIAHVPVDGMTYYIVEVVPYLSGTAGVIKVHHFTSNTSYVSIVNNGVLGAWKKVSDDASVVHNTGDETIVGNKTFTTGVYTNGGLFSKGVEVSNTTPYVDFHFGNSTSDFTSRIIETTSGKLSVLNASGTGKLVANIQGQSQSVNSLGMTIQGFAVGNTITATQPLAGVTGKFYGNYTGTIGTYTGTFNVEVTSNGASAMTVIARIAGDGTVYTGFIAGTFSGSTFTITTAPTWAKLATDSTVVHNNIGTVIMNSSSSSSGESVGTWSNIGSATIGTATVYYWKRTA